MKRGTISYSAGPFGARIETVSVTGPHVRVREHGSYTIAEAGEVAVRDGDLTLVNANEAAQVLTKNVISVKVGDASEAQSEDAG